jgi:tetratricopeptide (TPR) repeat protein
MDMFYIGFRDPLFSLIIFFTIIFLISFFSYWWGRYRRKENSQHLDKFLQQFHALPTEKELKVLISGGELSEKSWLLLAASYSKNGDYEKSIEIYNEILKVTSKKDVYETMFLLGKTYFKAGFLERSRQIFLEILKYNPRTPQVLHYLLLIYEYMRDYSAALDVLEPLDELQEDVALDKQYLHALFLLNKQEISDDEKIKQLLQIYKESGKLAYMVFAYLFRVNPAVAWENLNLDDAEVLAEVLWKMDLKDVNLDIIAKSKYLQELYSARGDVSLAKRSDIFEFDVLIGLEGRANATLSFEYVCKSCRGTYPFAFTRCSSCHAIDTAMVEFGLSKDYMKEFSEENNSFQ